MTNNRATGVGDAMAEAVPAMASHKPDWATSEDWDRHRDEITSLYKDSNKTLKEVAKHMQSTHRFHATLRMYKRRLSQWNVQKNVKAGEVLAVLKSKEYKPGDPSRPEVVKVNGRDVPVDKVEQYLERRQRQLKALRKKGVLDAQGQLSVPPKAPFSAPDRLQIPEEMGRLIQQYIDGSFDAGTWEAGRTRDELRSRNSAGNVVYLFSDLFDACSLLRRREIQAGFERINHSLDTMNRALKEEDPRFLVSTFRVLALCHWYNLPDIYRVLLTHLKRLSGIVLGSGHPASRIFRLLCTMPPSDRDVGMKVAAELLCRHLQKYVSQFGNSGAYLNLVVSYVDTLESLGMYDESIEGIVEAMKYPDPKFQWSAETLSLYFQFILRDGGEAPHMLPKAKVGEVPVCSPPKVHEKGKGLGISGPFASLDGSNEAAVEIMRYCYTLRASSLRAGRATAMTKGGASMWPSLVTCPDEERIRILKHLLATRETEPEPTIVHEAQKWGYHPATVANKNDRGLEPPPGVETWSQHDLATCPTEGEASPRYIPLSTPVDTPELLPHHTPALLTIQPPALLTAQTSIVAPAPRTGTSGGSTPSSTSQASRNNETFTPMFVRGPPRRAKTHAWSLTEPNINATAANMGIFAPTSVQPLFKRPDQRTA